MKNSKLIVFLETLSAAEMREWGRFIEASSAKKSPASTQFFEILYQYHPTFEEARIDKEKIALKLYPKDKNYIKKFDNLIYKFWGILEDFLAFKELEYQKRDKEFLLLEAMKRRRIDKFFFKKVDDLEKEWADEKGIGAKHFHDLYLLKKYRTQHSNYKEKVNKANNIIDLLKEFENYYLLVKYHNEIAFSISNNFIKKKELDGLIPIDVIHKFIGKKAYHSKGMTFISRLYEILNNDSNSQDTLTNVKADFFESIVYYSDDEKFDISNYMKLIYIIEYNSGNLEIIHDFFSVIKFIVEEKMIISEEDLDLHKFQSIVNIACAAQEVEWADNFIEEHKIYLSKESRENIIPIAKASVYLKKQAYEKVLEVLSVAKIGDDIMNYWSRCMQIMACYELEGYEELYFSLTKSFSLFLIRNKNLSKEQKNACKNFISFSKKLNHLKSKKNKKEDIDKLKKAIIDCEDIIYLSWLTEKLENLRF